MSNLTEQEIWPITINQVETNEFIIGGETGNANQATKQLADRTQFLLAKCNELEQRIDNGGGNTTTPTSCDITTQNQPLNGSSARFTITTDTNFTGRISASVIQDSNATTGTLAVPDEYTFPMVNGTGFFNHAPTHNTADFEVLKVSVSLNNTQIGFETFNYQGTVNTTPTSCDITTQNQPLGDSSSQFNITTNTNFSGDVAIQVIQDSNATTGTLAVPVDYTATLSNGSGSFNHEPLHDTADFEVLKVSVSINGTQIGFETFNY